MTHNAVLLVLDALATWRLTRLLIDDSITFWLRKPLVEGRGPAWLADLMTCPWCLSIWIATGVVVAQVLVPGQWIYVAAVLAFSAVAGLLEAQV